MYQIPVVSFKKGFLAGLLVILSLVKICAQETRKIDSLENLLLQSSGLQQFDVAYELGFEYFDSGDLNEALRVFERAEAIASAFGDSLKIVKSRRVKFQMLRRLDRSDEGILDLEKVFHIARRNGFREEQEYILNLLAIYHTLKANYDQALEYHFQNLVLREQNKDHSSIRESLNNIGVVYFKLRNYPKALEYYELAIQHDRQDAQSTFRDQLLINTALCHNQLKNFDIARQLIQEGMSYCAPTCSDYTTLHGEFGLGVSFYGQGLYAEAKSHFTKSLQIATRSDNTRFQAENLVYVAHIYVKNHEFDSALVALAKTESIALKHGYNELLIESYKEYANLFSIKGDYQNASLFQKKYITLKDSIYSGELIDRIAKITTQFQERVNLKTIADKEETIARQREFNIAIAVIAILGGALIFVLYRSIKVKRKVNADLSDAKAIIEDQNRQLMSSNVSLNQELKARNADLQKANESLQRVNEELDNFIYKTSHDIRGCRGKFCR